VAAEQYLVKSCVLRMASEGSRGGRSLAHALREGQKRRHGEGGKRWQLN